jgi:hypothetical protein
VQIWHIAEPFLLLHFWINGLYFIKQMKGSWLCLCIATCDPWLLQVLIMKRTCLTNVKLKKQPYMTGNSKDVHYKLNRLINHHYVWWRFSSSQFLEEGMHFVTPCSLPPFGIVITSWSNMSLCLLPAYKTFFFVKSKLNHTIHDNFLILGTDD